MFLRLRVFHFSLLVLTLGLVFAAGCGRKGALYHPTDDGKRPPEQTAPAPAK